jgi:hypothetical protein
MKFNSQSNTILNDEFEKKSIKKKEKETESTRLSCQTRNPVHETGTT